ncbi:MAG TPA: hypothetical protein PKI20_18650 [Verrucomicrobiota bacterium]|nr:hypothetical protein [Verrucomicrobiota bacterium]
MTHRDLPGDIEVYEIGLRRLYVKTGVRSFAISEGDVTPEELVVIAKDIADRQARPSESQIGQASVLGRGPDAQARETASVGWRK